jgi:hypothetical protein|tara:strand:- start:5224 stop:7239 length:2016 start_codon:yes stop_codon:yes gene_type:complete
MAEEITKKLADDLVDVARNQLQASQDHKQERMREILLSERYYANRAKKALQGQYNVPIPVMSGFVDTFHSKIDEPVSVIFGHNDEADLKRAMKVTAAHEVDSAPDHGQWDRKDRMAKKMALFSGRGIYQYHAENTPEYKSNFDVIDHLDFHCQPGGGSILDNHLFNGKENVYKTKSQLEEGVRTGLYNASQVQNLVDNQDEKTSQDIEDEAGLRAERDDSLRLQTVTQNNYVGEPLFTLCEWYLTYRGKRYYLLFESKSKSWLRVQPLKELYPSEKYPIVSWATHEDHYAFWSKAPADDMRPIHEFTRIALNEGLNNLRKRNWDMRVIDSNFFPDPSQFIYKQPDQIVVGSPPAGRQIQEGVYKFETPDTTNVTIRLIDYVKQAVSVEAGISPDAKGQSEEDKVSIYFGNLQQVADRIGLTSKAYNQAFTEIGVRYYEGLKEHLSESMFVKMVGLGGVEWDELKKEDLNPVRDFNITVTGGSAEARINEVKKKNRQQGTDKVVNLMASNPAAQGAVGAKWLLETILRESDFDDEEIRIAMDTENEGEREIMSEAADSIQMIIAGKEVKLNRGATTGFVQKILDFATDKIGIEDEETYQKLIDYANAHMDIVKENMARKVSMQVAATAPALPGTDEKTPLTGPPTVSKTENPLTTIPEGARVPLAPSALQPT